MPLAGGPLSPSQGRVCVRCGQLQQSLFDAETETAQCLAQFRAALKRGGVLDTLGNGCCPAALRQALFFLKRLQDRVIGIKIIPCGLRIGFMKQDG